jgi:hypothetical protein
MNDPIVFWQFLLGLLAYDLGKDMYRWTKKYFTERKLKK